MGFNLVATGSTKELYQANGPGTPGNILFAIAKHPWQNHRLKQELSLTKKIQSAVQRNHLSDANLLLDLHESTSIKPHNKYTLSIPKASRDLDEEILDKTLSVSERLKLCRDVSSAISNLHQAGFVHQDLKTSNFLIFSSWGSKTAKLTDFETAKPIGKQEVLFQRRGNIQYASPENVMSQKGEVFSLALLLIRILEESVLPCFPSTSTLVPAPKRALPFAQYKQARGIIQYLISHPFSDRSSFTGILTCFKRVIAYLKYKLTGNELYLLRSYDKEHAVHTYIDALQSKLSSHTSMPTHSIGKICTLLKRMTLADPLQRPSAKEVASFFRTQPLSNTDHVRAAWNGVKDFFLDLYYNTNLRAS